MISRTSHSPELLEFARGLVVYEAAFAPPDQAAIATPPEPGLSAGFRVSDKLRQPLMRLAGVTGFRMLLARALTLAKARTSGLAQGQLNAVQVKPDGSLNGMNNAGSGNIGDRLPLNDNDAAVVLIAELLALLVAFVGEAFTLSLVRDVWPGFPVLETELWRKSNS
jgi:hypothetical protein